MASNESRGQSVQFPVNWTINWSELEKGFVEKTFVTSYNNVPLLWQAEASFTDSSFICFSLFYKNGPIKKFNNMEYAISMLKPDLSIAKTGNYGAYEAERGYYGWDAAWDPPFEKKDPVAFRAKYGLEESDPLIMCITLKIPMAVFAYAPTASPPASLPHLGSTSLKALGQFLHTGQADVANLTTTDLIEVINAAGKYNLEPLKEACVVVLWKEVKNPQSCGEILRFAHLHNLKDLKYRAMDVLAENYHTLLANDEDDNDYNDTVNDFFQSKRLRNEFVLFLSRRVTPNLPG